MSPPKRIAYIVGAFFAASLFFSWLLTRSTRAPEPQVASLTQTGNANNSNALQNQGESGTGMVERAGARHAAGEELPLPGQARIVFTASEGMRVVKTLRQDDVRVTDEGVAQRNFTLKPEPNLPLSLAILVDTSTSQNRVMAQERTAVAAFLGRTVQPERDNASVISFAGQAHLEQDLTNNVGDARAALERMRVAGAQPGRNSNARGGGARATPRSGAAIWDALWFACDQVLESSPAEARRAIILLTDGEDAGSTKKMSEVIERALRSDVAVYSIGVGEDARVRKNQDVLRHLSEATGGLAFFPKTDDEMRDALAQIQQTLRSQFVITYAPSDDRPDDSFHRVEIEIINPDLRRQRVRVVHRRGYYAGGLAYPSQNK
ncbi:MAG TPA: VWA domain-containing protein [Pyrinomonadaceae bacterium]|nr:VWA domain-containing protein [Pyrinomonadaceae bacterium]